MTVEDFGKWLLEQGFLEEIWQSTFGKCLLNN